MGCYANMVLIFEFSVLINWLSWLNDDSDGFIRHLTGMITVLNK